MIYLSFTMALSRNLLPVMMLAMSVSLLPAQNVPDCGGLNQRTCHPFDSEFYTNGSGACDRGLKINLRGVKQDRCTNDDRQQLNKDYSWVAWALGQQRLNIAANEPINWQSHLTAHNAFNNSADGYMYPNQAYSITDQLNLGIRAINLDVHYEYKQVRVCHGDNNSVGCIATDRLFSYAAREIGDWVKSNPGEVVIVIFENRAEDHSKDIEKSIKELIGTSLVWTKTDSSNTGTSYRLPTTREMLAAGKQVIFVSEIYADTIYVHDISSNGYKSSKVMNFTASTCTSMGTEVNSVKVNDVAGKITVADWFYWPQLYEGRSKFESTDDANNLMWEQEVANAAACNVSNISIDFVNALDKAAKSPRSWDPDRRREAAVWSWKQGDNGIEGNYALFETSSGRWVSRKENFVAAYACAAPRDVSSLGTAGAQPNLWADPKGESWYITTAKANFNAGLSYCRELGRSLGKDLAFARPVNGYQAKKLLQAARNAGVANVWINNTIRPVPQPALTPHPIVFLVGERQTPEIASQKVTIWGTPQRQFTAKLIHDPLVPNWLHLNATSGVVGDFGASVTVTLDSAIIRTLKKGNYTTTLEVRMVKSQPTDPDQVNRIPVFLRVMVPTQTSLTLLNASAVATGQPAQFQARVQYPTGLGYLVSGVVELRELVNDPETGTSVVKVSEAVVNSFAHGDTNAQDTVRLTASLSQGAHEVAAFYRGDSDYGPSLSNSITFSQKAPVTVTVTSNVAATAPGEAVTFTATINENEAGTPTGTVKFSAGTIILGTAPVSAGKAALTTTAVPIGLQPVRAEYSGDAAFGGAAGTLTHRVAAKVAYTIQTTPAGLPFTVDGQTYIGKFTFTWTPGLKHTVSVQTEIDPKNGNRYVEPKWSDGGAATHEITVPSVTATLGVRYTHYVTLTTVVPTGAHTGSIRYQSPTGTSLIIAGQTVKVSAETEPGYAFMGWSGASTATTTSVNLYMDGPKTISARFEPLVSVTVGSEYSVIPVVVDGQSFTGSKTFQWPKNSKHTISAHGSYVTQAITYQFEGWSNLPAGTLHNITVGATPVTYIANYKRNFAIMTTINPSATGTLTIIPTPVNGKIAEGTQVTIIAKPAAGYRFAGYSGSIVGTNPTVAFTMDQTKSITANFVK